MTGYWTRHRLLWTLILCAGIALITSFLFVYPSIMQEASLYNTQSIYKNSEIDFVAPEPSFKQVNDLPGTNGIDKVFPYYLTKTQVNVNGSSRSTTVLLSDRFENVGMTMYNANRLIEQSKTEYENPILVDWQFCQDTSANIGDTVSLTIGGNSVEYKIYAIYETNSIYDGGAVLARITDAQREAIAQQSNNNGYSGMYVSASDYSACKAYLTTEYRPLGRLKSRDQFSDDAQYQVHYDAIMSSGYANEITDFRARESSLSKAGSSFMVWLGAVIAAAALLVFNLIMSKRGCEKVYFRKHCLPKGQDVKSYYSISFVLELLLSVVLFSALLFLRINLSKEYIPGSAIGFKIAIVPAAMVIAEIICLAMNKSMVSELTKQVEAEMRKKKQQEEKIRNESESEDEDDQIQEKTKTSN